MSRPTLETSTTLLIPRRRSYAATLRSPRALWSSFRRLPLIPAVILLFAIFTVLVAPLVQGRLIKAPEAIDLAARYAPPLPLDGSSAAHPLGADQLGRDVLSRMLFGMRLSLLVAASVILLGGIVGSTGGLMAGYVGGFTDIAIMRLADVVLTFPAILLALALVVTVGPSFWLVVGVLSVQLSPQFARVVRSEALALKQREFVVAARVTGASTTRIVRRHVLPNALNSIVVLVTLQIGWVIVAESGLSFLGAGVPPPAPTLGNMLADGRQVMGNAWWLTVLPGTAIAALVLSFNLMGDWLRDTLDPKLRRVGSRPAE